MIYVKMMLAIVLLVVTTVLLGMSLLTLSGCTLSFQNVSTHGMAEDLIDENQAASPTVSPNIDIKPMPGLGIPA